MIGLTGSTGQLGSRIAARLAGVPLRLIVRDPGRAPSVPGASVMQAAYGEHAALLNALDGVDVLMLLSATESADRVALHKATVDAAVAAGVQRIVYTSFVGASPGATFTFARDHWHTEQHIRSTGVDFTFLRDNLYLDFVSGGVGEDGVIRGPAGDGRVAAVSRDDVAAVAATVLLSTTPAPQTASAAPPSAAPAPSTSVPGAPARPASAPIASSGSGALGASDGLPRVASDHSGATYDLTGPRAFTLAEAAAVLTDAWGRKVRYEPETLDEAYRSRESYGAPAWEVAGWVTSYAAIASGELSQVSTAVRDITGVEPTGFEEYVRAQ
ncbi:SDR family oxidoreductase [Kribbella jiaozuonensis]|uniref:SDR family oxidoreductase n=1 Tax=Kribbella jiaozuonensis TaxID=2575441 RepID=A0A4U3M6S9_9ACTN|nr:SDR family oxidoreductase [Kribbella jiaozuonensis]TKK83147.1 SDR family oxidoreductase [Kribbella jiaozuonensis]